MAITQIGSTGRFTSVRSNQAATQKDSQVQTDDFQSGPPQLLLRVSPSRMNSPDFHKELSDFARSGIQVQVEMVPDGTPSTFSRTDPVPPQPPAKANLPTVAPQPGPKAPEPGSLEAFADAAIRGSGLASAIVAGIGCACVGALGAVSLGVLLNQGGGGLQNMLLQHGTLGMITSGFMGASLTTKAGALFAALSAGVAGGPLAIPVGKFLAKAILAPWAALGGNNGLRTLVKLGTDTPKTPKPPRPVGSISGALASTALLAGGAGGFLAGASFLATGNPLGESLALANLTGSTLLAGGMGAVAFGALSAVGGLRVATSAQKTPPGP